MKYFIFYFFISICISGTCQDHGFFGKKNVLSINGTGAIPAINMIAEAFNSSNALYTSQLTQTKNYFDGGFNASIIHGFSNSFGFGVEYAMTFGNSRGPTFVEYQDEFGFLNRTNIIHEMLDLTTMTFMPKIEFTTTSSLISVGLHSEFGIGYSRTKVKDRKYASTLPYDLEEVSISSYNRDKIFNKDDAYHSLTLQYGLCARVPISKSFMLQCGVRYSLNFNTNIIGEDWSLIESKESNKGYYTSKQDMGEIISKHRLFSVITGNVGLAFMF
jgi:hypothetical protein